MAPECDSVAATRRLVGHVKNADRLLVGLIIVILGLWGCLTVYNSSLYGQNPLRFALRQLLWLGVGSATLVAASLPQFTFYQKHTSKIALAFWIPLVLVLFLGTKVNGMRGWFDFDLFFIQPSELAKPIFVLCLCQLAVRHETEPCRFTLMAGTFLFGVLPITLQPDYGTAMIYAGGFVMIYWLAGGKALYLLATFLAGAVSAVWAVNRHPYILRRVISTLFPDADPSGAGWHASQLRQTIARGGVWGESLGNAVWSHTYLPLSHSDSVFASMAESLGLVGVLPVIAGFALLVCIGYIVSTKARDPGSALFCRALPALVTLQAYVHISVNVGALPPTGVTLPFFSYGGSSLVSIMLGFGMLISATRPQRDSKTQSGSVDT